jgi:hypothetical protein
MKKLPNDSTSVSFESADGDQRRGPGRPTVNNEILRGDRDALVWALSIKWGDCGWQIQNAATVAELRRALEPLRGHCPEHLITPFLRVTSLPATASEVRSLKKAQGEAVRRDREARDKHDRRAELARKAELAMNQTEPARPPTLHFSSHGGRARKRGMSWKGHRRISRQLKRILRTSQPVFPRMNSCTTSR